MDFYRSLISDPQKRLSLQQNDLVEFAFNSDVFSLQFYSSFYSALAQVELTDVMTKNIQQGTVAAEGRALTVRIQKIQRFHHFDKFLILVKLQGDEFDFERSFVFDTVDP